MSYSFILYPVVIKEKRYRLPSNANTSRYIHWNSKRLVDDAFVEQAYYGIKEAAIPKCNKIILLFEEHACHFSDEDNLISSMKKIKDCIVRCGIVKDDSHEYVTTGQITHIKEAHRKDEYLKVIIEPC